MPYVRSFRKLQFFQCNATDHSKLLVPKCEQICSSALPYFVTACQQICGKVIFSEASVCSQWGSHVTIINNPLDLTEQGPVQTCSLQDSPVVLTSGDYWITYCWRKWAVRILLECFLVSSSNSMRNNILAFDIWRLLYLFILRSSLFFGS